MRLPGVETLVDERRRLVFDVAALDERDFEHGTTLCSAWAPRDVLAHVLGVSSPVAYLRGGLRVNAVNATTVDAARGLERDELLERAYDWVEHPSPTDQAAAVFLLGDVAMHRQDVLRGLGLPLGDVPGSTAGAILREGVVLSTGTRRNLLRHRVQGTTAGGFTVGRGRLVRGPTDALGLWLAGRQGVADELEFAAA